MNEKSGLPTGKHTLVEEGTEFKGSMTSTCPVVVRGKIQGELSTPALSVAPTGIVQGRAHVGTMDSSGQLAGEFDADTVKLSGAVSADTMNDSVNTDGSSRMRSISTGSSCSTYRRNGAPTARAISSRTMPPAIPAMCTS